ncbi:tetratricopeptide repeat-containing sulfotransferase family protein [Glaciecola sp. 1036]|uniref:tetratricopeptide repeat-containing sulfotransferase family protein n=1 Tax=Alteromonadaceae TaxID=72275 RepID=UPI003D02CAB4
MLAATQNPVAEALALGQSLEQKNKPNEAIQVYQNLLGRVPNNEEAIIRITQIFLRHKEYANAVKSLNYYLKITKNKELAHYNLGIAYQKLRKNEEAINAFIAAIKANAGYPLSYAPLYSLLERFGRLSEMRELIAKVHKKHEKVGEIAWMQAKLLVAEKAFVEAADIFAKAEKLGICKEMKSIFFSDYAHLLAKCGRYDDAMEVHKKAQKLLSLTPDAKAVDETFSENVIKFSYQGFAEEEVKQWQTTAVSDKNDPIFVIGFPRSGTTLMEQILSAHPNLIVTDELQVLRKRVANLNQLLGRTINYPKGLNTLSKKELNTIREAYFKGMSEELPEYDKHLRIVDKVPMSIKFLGFIKRLFPESPILMMIRDPRDVCLSCFFQHFASNESTVNFFSLKQTFEYYAKTMELYLFFKERLGANIMEVKYETMCEDFEPYARRIMEHVGENWQDSLLDFYKPQHSRFIATPSFDAVSQPVNKKAVGNWQNYTKHIEPLEPIIAPYLDKFGYARISELK